MFFGDMLLRLPDITSRILARHKEWDLLIKWSVGFCNESSIFEKRDVQVLNFVSIISVLRNKFDWRLWTEKSWIYAHAAASEAISGKETCSVRFRWHKNWVS